MDTDCRDPTGKGQWESMDMGHKQPCEHRLRRAFGYRSLCAHGLKAWRALSIGNRDPIETSNAVLGPRPGEETQKVYVEKQTGLQHEAEKQCWEASHSSVLWRADKEQDTGLGLIGLMRYKILNWLVHVLKEDDVTYLRKPRVGRILLVLFLLHSPKLKNEPLPTDTMDAGRELFA